MNSSNDTDDDVVISVADGTWSSNNMLACSFDKGTGRNSWGREPSLCNKTCIFWWLCIVQQAFYCHCWFAPVIPDGTADPGAAVPSLLWKPWSYLTPLCRQVPCHPAKPHWLPVQKGPPAFMQMGKGVGGAMTKAFPSPQPLFYSFPFFPLTALLQPATQIYNLILRLMLSGPWTCLDGLVCDRQRAIKLPNTLSVLESFCKNNSPVLCISERDSFMASTYSVCKRNP